MWDWGATEDDVRVMGRCCFVVLVVVAAGQETMWQSTSAIITDKWIGLQLQRKSKRRI